MAKSKLSLVQYTIEFRCGVKHEKQAKKLVIALARAMKAISNDPDTQVVAYSDDYVQGHEEIARHAAS